jgi:hypothetical protein
MLRIVTVALLLLCASRPCLSQNIVIGIIGDQTRAPKDGSQYEILKKGVTTLNEHRPDIVVHVGDLLESVTPGLQPAKPSDYQASYRMATDILNGLSCKWYLSAGDHDLSPPYTKLDDTSIRDLFQTLYPPVKDHLYYSFDAKGYHFIALSSQEVPNVDPRWGDIFRDHLSAQQIAWLKDDLHRNQRAKGIIVFLHQPLWYQWTDWAPIHALLREHHVTAVIAGHFHYNQDEGELDGIRYLVVGATGADTKAGLPQAGNLQHVSLMTIENGGVRKLELLPLRNEPVTSFASRQDMDRIQALDVSLGNAFNDTAENHNEVRQIGTDNVWKSCAGDKNASLILKSIGNPIDRPVTLAIAPTGNFQPTDAKFVSKFCKLEDGTNCELPPAALVAYSNNSAVDPAYRSCGDSGCKYRDVEPLWIAQFSTQTSDGRAVSENFTLKATFRGESGQALEVDKTISLGTYCDP